MSRTMRLIPDGKMPGFSTGGYDYWSTPTQKRFAKRNGRSKFRREHQRAIVDGLEDARLALAEEIEECSRYDDEINVWGNDDAPLYDPRDDDYDYDWNGAEEYDYLDNWCSPSYATEYNYEEEAATRIVRASFESGMTLEEIIKKLRN